MMTHNINTLNLPDFLGKINQLSVGMEPMFRDVMEWGNSYDSGNYPPYNIVNIGEFKWAIEVACAGFSDKDIEVTQDDNSLTIKGNKDKDEDAEYAHRSIAKRAFTRTFKLGEYVNVVTATIKDGMLNIELERELPDHMKPRQIPVVVG